MQKDYLKAKISVARTLMQIFAVAGILHIFYLAANYRRLNEIQILFFTSAGAVYLIAAVCLALRILNLAEKLDEF